MPWAVRLGKHPKVHFEASHSARLLLALIATGLPCPGSLHLPSCHFSILSLRSCPPHSVPTPPPEDSWSPALGIIQPHLWPGEAVKWTDIVGGPICQGHKAGLVACGRSLSLPVLESYYPDQSFLSWRSLPCLKTVSGGHRYSATVIQND